jgi:hypothetical protein
VVADLGGAELLCPDDVAGLLLVFVVDGPPSEGGAEGGVPGNTIGLPFGT